MPSTRQIYGRPQYLPVDEGATTTTPADVAGVRQDGGRGLSPAVPRRVRHQHPLAAADQRLRSSMRIKDARQGTARHLTAGRWRAPFDLWAATSAAGIRLRMPSRHVLSAALSRGAAGAPPSMSAARRYAVALRRTLVRPVAAVAPPFPDERKRIGIGDFITANSRRYATDRPGRRVQAWMTAWQCLDYYHRHLASYLPGDDDRSTDPQTDPPAPGYQTTRPDQPPAISTCSPAIVSSGRRSRISSAFSRLSRRSAASVAPAAPMRSSSPCAPAASRQAIWSSPCRTPWSQPSFVQRSSTSDAELLVDIGQQHDGPTALEAALRYRRRASRQSCCRCISTASRSISPRSANFTRMHRMRIVEIVRRAMARSTGSGRPARSAISAASAFIRRRNSASAMPVRPRPAIPALAAAAPGSAVQPAGASVYVSIHRHQHRLDPLQAAILAVQLPRC